MKFPLQDRMKNQPNLHLADYSNIRKKKFTQRITMSSNWTTSSRITLIKCKKKKSIIIELQANEERKKIKTLSEPIKSKL